MAKFDGKHLRGLLGNLIFKKTKRGGVVTTRGKNVRQTAATKKSANFFGRVANFSGLIRQALKAVGYPDTGFMNRLNKELLAILLQCYDKETKTFNFTNTHFSRLEGMDFNNNSLWRESLFEIPSYTKTGDQLIIRLPEMNTATSLVFPDTAEFCELYIQPIQIDLNGGHVKKMDTIQVEISKNQVVVAAQEFSINLFAGTLCLIAIGIQYYKKKSGRYIELNNIDFSPAAFAYAAFHEGVFNELVSEPFEEKQEVGIAKGKRVYWHKSFPSFPIGQLPLE
ncbi:MAG: hypothetical protein EOO20_18235 [Chryseobacterium sp.]|nr:MAG: hypothetical protein EOO20_18235 [Chryseobacterium sp.]